MTRGQMSTQGFDGLPGLVLLAARKMESEPSLLVCVRNTPPVAPTWAATCVAKSEMLAGIEIYPLLKLDFLFDPRKGSRQKFASGSGRTLTPPEGVAARGSKFETPRPGARSALIQLLCWRQLETQNSSCRPALCSLVLRLQILLQGNGHYRVLRTAVGLGPLA